MLLVENPLSLLTKALFDKPIASSPWIASHVDRETIVATHSLEDAVRGLTTLTAEAGIEGIQLGAGGEPCVLIAKGGAQVAPALDAVHGAAQGQIWKFVRKITESVH